MGRPSRLLLTLIFSAGLTACRSSKSGGPVSANDRFPKEQSELRMTGMKVQSYTNDGLEWELSAPYGEVFTRRNLMRVRTMTVQMYENNKRSTAISANQGLMSTGPKPETMPAKSEQFEVNLDSGDMYLSGDVVMVSTEGTKLTTDWARYTKKTDLVTSTAPVRVVRPDSITNGMGMEASSDMSRVHIFNETLVIPEKNSEGVQ